MKWKMDFVWFTECCAIGLYTRIAFGDCRPMEVHIVSPMVSSANFLASAVFNSPPMQIAIREVNREFPTLNISWTLMTGNDIADCLSMMYNIERVFSDYMFNRNVPSDVTAVIAPGTLCTHHFP